jgi:hypothetical protein
MALAHSWDPPRSFDVSVRRVRGAVTLCLEGDVDEEAAAQVARWVRDLLEDQGNVNVAIDLDAVTSCVDDLEELLYAIVRP